MGRGSVTTNLLVVVMAMVGAAATSSLRTPRHMDTLATCKPIDVCLSPCRLVTNKDEGSCPECDCTQQGPQCQPVQCLQTCAVLKDESGCEVCDCSIQCQEISHCPCPPCKLIRGELGCPLCHCQSQPPIWCLNAPLPCHTNCTGYDFQGCPQCLCNQQRCGDEQCEPNCGIRKNSFGCEECDCPPPFCPPTIPSCKEGCHLVKDGRGCQTCYCPPRCSASKEKTCSICACVKCSRETCEPGCSVRKDAAGCDMCECAACPFVTCPIGCVEMKGKGGCFTCNCDPRPAP